MMVSVIEWMLSLSPVREDIDASRERVCLPCLESELQSDDVSDWSRIRELIETTQIARG